MKDKDEVTHGVSKDGRLWLEQDGYRIAMMPSEWLALGKKKMELSLDPKKKFQSVLGHALRKWDLNRTGRKIWVLLSISGGRDVVCMDDGFSPYEDTSVKEWVNAKSIERYNPSKEYGLQIHQLDAYELLLLKEYNAVIIASVLTINTDR